ncbi:MAG: hypothetical protein ACT4TC_22050, partial [Myxococcaceae bacterium]
KSGEHPGWVSKALWTAAIVAMLANASLGIASVVYSARKGKIRLDQGQNTYRAALMFARGENPYGRGAILDLEAFNTRLETRVKEGVGPKINLEALPRYWETLDPQLRAQLLPTDGTSRESALLGYKYGPVLFLAALPFARLIGPAGIPLLNLLCFLGWAFALFKVVRALGLRSEIAALALLAVFLDRNVGWNFLYYSCSDIWVLLFGALAVLAHLRGWPLRLGLFVALALGSKLFPAALYLPLLLLHRRSLLTFAATAAALFVPWVLWDGQGLVYNLLLWPSLMAPDTTSWVAFASTRVVWAIRGVLLATAAWAMLQLLRQRAPLMWTLALSNLSVVAAGNAIHNNYLPWFSAWAVLAFASVSLPREEATQVHVTGARDLAA